MNVDEIVSKLRKMIDGPWPEGGRVVFAGLFVPENEGNEDLMDFVIAATHLRSDSIGAYRGVADAMRANLTPKEISQITRILIFDQDSSVLKSFQERFSETDGWTDLHYVTEGGAVIKKAWVISSEKDRGQGPKSKPSQPQSRKSSRVLKGPSPQQQQPRKPPQKRQGSA